MNVPDSVMSRSKARELLGLPADAVVLFTVAMPHKYVLFESGALHMRKRVTRHRKAR